MKRKLRITSLLSAALVFFSVCGSVFPQLPARAAELPADDISISTELIPSVQEIAENTCVTMEFDPLMQETENTAAISADDAALKNAAASSAALTLSLNETELNRDTGETAEFTVSYSNLPADIDENQLALDIQHISGLGSAFCEITAHEKGLFRLKAHPGDRNGKTGFSIALIQQETNAQLASAGFSVEATGESAESEPFKIVADRTTVTLNADTNEEERVTFRLENIPPQTELELRCQPYTYRTGTAQYRWDTDTDETDILFQAGGHGGQTRFTISAVPKGSLSLTKIEITCNATISKADLCTPYTKNLVQTNKTVDVDLYGYNLPAEADTIRLVQNYSSLTAYEFKSAWNGSRATLTFTPNMRGTNKIRAEACNAADGTVYASVEFTVTVTGGYAFDFYCNASEVKMQKDQSWTIQISCENVPYGIPYSFRYERSKTSTASCKWSSFYGYSQSTRCANFTVTPSRSGIETFTFSLFNTETQEVLKTCQVRFIITGDELEFYLSEESVKMDTDDDGVKTVTAYYANRPESVKYFTMKLKGGNTSIVVANLKAWNKDTDDGFTDSCDIELTAKAPGTAVFDMILADSATDETLKTVKLTVTVTNGAMRIEADPGSVTVRGEEPQTFSIRLKNYREGLKKTTTTLNLPEDAIVSYDKSSSSWKWDAETKEFVMGITLNGIYNGECTIPITVKPTIKDPETGEETTLAALETEIRVKVIGCMIRNPEAKPFEWGRDNWNFRNPYHYFSTVNVNSDDVTQHETLNDMLGESFREQLLNHLPNTDYYYLLNNKAFDSYYRGVCYGMTALLHLASAGYMDYEMWGLGETCIHDFSKPVDNPLLRSLIVYYYLLQKTRDIQVHMIQIVGSSHKENICRILDGLKESPTVSVGFQWNDPKSGNFQGHQVLAVGTKLYEKPVTTDEGTFNARIILCDPNFSDTESTIEMPKANSIYYNTSTYEWWAPAYSGASSKQNASFNFISTDSRLIGQYGLLPVEKPEQDSFIQLLNKNNHSLSISKAIRTENGYQNTNEKESDFRISNQRGDLLNDPDSVYYIQTDDTGTINLILRYPDKDIQVTSGNNQSVIIDPEGYIELVGKAAGTRFITLTENKDYLTDWCRLNFSVRGSKVSIRQTEEGYIVSSDNPGSLSVFANNRDDGLSVYCEDTSKYKSLLVYEINRAQLGINADTDGDGTYETKVASSYMKKGDLDLSNKLSIADAVLLERLIAEDPTCQVPDAALENADYNRDGIVNLLDSRALRKALAA